MISDWIRLPFAIVAILAVALLLSSFMVPPSEPATVEQTEKVLKERSRRTAQQLKGFTELCMSKVKAELQISNGINGMTFTCDNFNTEKFFNVKGGKT